MKRKIILASSSPRRRDLLAQIGLREIVIRESEYEEDMTLDMEPGELVKFLALKKGEDVAKHYDDAVIISGDTIVLFEGKKLGKPKSEDEAREMLRSFSGKVVVGMSGLAVIDTKSGKVVNDFGQAEVKFKKLLQEEIDDYVATGESLGMAGAFGLMNRAAPLIDSVSGDFYSVIALPLNRLAVALREMGVDIYKNS